MMPGGDKKAYETVAPILKKIAAHVDGEPTVAYMGVRSAGHFVKMVHNGIEYALMQLISEVYEVLKMKYGDVLLTQNPFQVQNTAQTDNQKHSYSEKLDSFIKNRI